MSLEGRRIETDDATLNLREYEDQFSFYWVTDESLDEVLEAVEQMRSPSSDSPVVLDGGRSYEDIEYGSLLEGREPPAPFVAIYADDYVLTWEEYEDDARIGVRASDRLHELAVELFEETADTDVSADDYDIVESFVFGNVV